MVWYTRLRDGVEWLIGPTAEGARKEDGDEDGEEKFQVLAGQDRTGHAWHAFLVSRFRKSQAEFEVKRSEKK